MLKKNESEFYAVLIEYDDPADGEFIGNLNNDGVNGNGPILFETKSGAEERRIKIGLRPSRIARVVVTEIIPARKRKPSRNPTPATGRKAGGKGAK